MVKPSSRPVWTTPSRKNQENLVKEHIRELTAFERRAATYRAHAHEECHHHHPSLTGKQMWPFNGGALMKSRHPEGCEVVFDTITAEARVVNGGSWAGDSRPASAPITRSASSFSSASAGSYSAAAAARAEYATQRQQLLEQRQAGGLPSTAGATPAIPSSGRGRGWASVAQGRYDPLRHEWLQAPDAALHRMHQKDLDRQAGNIGIRCSAGGGGGDAGGDGAAADAPRAAAAGPSRNPITGAGIGGGASKAASRQLSGKAGQSWGTYDVFSHEYKVPPKDPKFVKQEELCERAAFVSGRGLRRVPLPGSQGVYDPIRGNWVVPPKDPRSERGLDFAPRDTFRAKGGCSRPGHF